MASPAQIRSACCSCYGDRLYLQLQCRPDTALLTGLDCRFPALLACSAVLPVHSKSVAKCSMLTERMICLGMQVPGTCLAAADAEATAPRGELLEHLRGALRRRSSFTPAGATATMSIESFAPILHTAQHACCSTDTVGGKITLGRMEHLGPGSCEGASG